MKTWIQPKSCQKWAATCQPPATADGVTTSVRWRTYIDQRGAALQTDGMTESRFVCPLFMRK
jgi:hypothetical protein